MKRSDSAAQPFDVVIVLPVLAVGVITSGGAVVATRFLPQAGREYVADSALAGEIAGQMRAWLRDPRFHFDLPLAPAGTAFQRRVWGALREISPGETRTYGALARELRSAARAIGGACRANPIPLLIPCHRVVAANGLGGFSGERAGQWLALKRWLLAHEDGRRDRA